MIPSRFLTVAFGSLVATAAIIPTVPTTASEHPAVAAANVISSTIASSPRQIVQRGSKDDEETDLDNLADHTFIVGSQDPRPADKKYSEYPLLQKLQECNRRLGSDPAMIEGQSLIGNTTLLEVRYSQCNRALLDCATTAMTEADALLNGWPGWDDEARPVLRTHSLQICTNRCVRTGSMDNRIVSENSGMTRDQFKKLGTVAFCNVEVIKCFETCEVAYDGVMSVWNARNPDE